MMPKVSNIAVTLWTNILEVISDVLTQAVKSRQTEPLAWSQPPLRDELCPSTCFNNNDPISFLSVNLLSVFSPSDQYKLLPAGDYMIHYLLHTHKAHLLWSKYFSKDSAYTLLQKYISTTFATWTISINNVGVFITTFKRLSFRTSLQHEQKCSLCVRVSLTGHDIGSCRILNRI